MALPATCPTCPGCLTSCRLDFRVSGSQCWGLFHAWLPKQWDTPSHTRRQGMLLASIPLSPLSLARGELVGDTESPRFACGFSEKPRV